MFNPSPFGNFRLDQLNRALLIGGVGFSLLKSFWNYGTAARSLFSILAAACLIFALVRLLVSNPEKRYKENQKFMTLWIAVCGIWKKLAAFFRNAFEKISSLFQRKTVPERKTHKRSIPTYSDLKQYKYFHCPQCRQQLRVPRGKGRLRVTCTRCGNKFEIKS